MKITDETPIVMLTVEQLKKILGNFNYTVRDTEEVHRRYVYGIEGIATLFKCSRVTDVG